jgi:hypothetical protein
MKSESIIKAIMRVTERWAKQRKAEERDAERISRREQSLLRSQKVQILKAAFEVMEACYLKASSGKRYPAHARQIFYPARGPVQERTGLQLIANYFTQKLLPRYLRENPQTTADWDVVFDARGHFFEPHTGREVALGTLDVRHYLSEIRGHTLPRVSAKSLGVNFPTCGPAHRIAGILFLEKEGFLPLLRAARLAERFDLALMSTKGVSNTSSRALVDALSAEHQVPLLIARDFDKSGFTIARTICHTTERYRFASQVRAVDVGLRLADVRAWGLESEEVFYKGDPSKNLYKNGATEEEVDFLYRGDEIGVGHVGRRVELNSFASGDLLDWIESKLKDLGIEKVVPDAQTLEKAYRRAAAIQIINEKLKRVARRALREAKGLPLPLDIESRLRQRLARDPALPWDEALSELVAEQIEGRGAF